jgi:NADPH-dependent 2,4-dienoyl-CoA reductase/sulfur reductase-like enzyme
VRSLRIIGIVGSSLAGLSAARALRKQGFDGRLVIIGAEPHRPYDRPPLSKSFLAGKATEDQIALEFDGENLDADWRIGLTATALRPNSRQIELSDGSSLEVDGVVLATGAVPRMLPGVPDVTRIAGAHVLRSLDDARALRGDLIAGARLVVVGAGFIGAEVAATARGLGLDVTVIEAAPTPLVGPLGAEMGAVVAALHADHGVKLRCGVGVAGLTGLARVEGVALADGSIVAADVVVIGVGVRPDINWLDGSGLDFSNGVLCSAFGATSVPQVVAVGDCATWYEPTLGKHCRLEHWTAARERAASAVATLLSGGTETKSTKPPYFWSDQYGLTIQVSGHTQTADSVQIEEGSAEERDFLAVYRHQGVPVAVLAMNHARSFMRWRRQLAAASAAVPATTLDPA